MLGTIVTLRENLMFALRLLLSWLFAVFLIFVYVNATLHPLPDPPEGFVKLFDRPGIMLFSRPWRTRPVLRFSSQRAAWL